MDPKLILAIEEPQLIEHFGATHLLALAFTLFIGFILIYFSRKNPSSQIVVAITILIAFLLITAYPVKIIGRCIDGIEINKDVIYPLQLCDVAAVAGFFALILKNRLCAEITYFFGLAGTLQALFTPSTCYDFPSISYFSFFQLHSTVVIAALYLPLVLCWKPRKGSVMRVWFCGICYMIIVGLFNFITGANYGFLREKAEDSLMDILHPWPYYLIEMTVLALVLFFLLSLPFWRRAGSKG
ncbi:MAG: TIGR02206 family membrane protein [Verrucomicrobiota bacterium]|jgi:hypothetical integral membrane protein (TIGR02206 family)|nr:TIGR02206 family membrane protein [Verrucomicrobiota bacterium]HAA87047.1 TIGR02206 family membrane protein [Verrucomicrobiales bacterium]